MSLVRSGFVPLPMGPRPGFDHADLYRARCRPCAAHTGADRVEVIDSARQLHARPPEDLPGVAEVLVDEGHHLLFTSDRGAARVRVFRCSDEQPLDRIGVGPHPNGLAYDRKRRQLYAFNPGEPLGDNCTASVVDLVSSTVATELPLLGRPRRALYDEERDRVYANIRDPAQIIAIDPGAHSIECAFDVPSEGPHGLWLESGRLFCAADGQALVVLDSVSGERLASLPLPGAPDVVMHDPEENRLYVAIGDPGLVCSFDSALLEHLETPETEPGAHATCRDPLGRALHVFCPGSGGAAVYEDRS